MRVVKGRSPEDDDIRKDAVDNGLDDPIFPARDSFVPVDEQCVPVFPGGRPGVSDFMEMGVLQNAIEVSL